MKERWRLQTKRADFQAIARKYEIDPVLARIIRNRDIESDNEIYQYLYGTVEDLHNPLLMKGMREAADLVDFMVRHKKGITVASDFDDDGIFASMILWTGIRQIGGRVTVDTPDRVREGYGLNNRIVEQACKRGDSMILTCDNGIAAFEAISYAKSLGLTVCVTDHHEVLYEEIDGVRTYRYPEADVIVNPKQPDCTYPFPKLCGAGVAWKLIQVLYERHHIPKEEWYELLEYTAIATVADVMDLQGENRIIVREGLRRLEHTKNKGLRALIKLCDLEDKKISAYHIGFIIGPCFNAAGRLETVKLALELLTETMEGAAMEKASRLKALNDERKDMTQRGVEQAIDLIEKNQLHINHKVLCICLQECHESLAGIIAGRIREQYYRPTFIFTEVEGGLKGSGRSIECYNMYENLVKCKELLGKFGGHPMAAGLSLQKENFSKLNQMLNEKCTLTEKELIPVVRIDAAMPIHYLSEGLIESLELLEPFGKANEKPLFAEQHFSIMKASIIGKNKNVMKMFVLNQAGVSMEALYFGDIQKLERFMVENYGSEQVNRMYRGLANTIDIAFTYYPSMNEFRGIRTIQIVVQNYCKIKQ